MITLNSQSDFSKQRDKMLVSIDRYLVLQLLTLINVQFQRIKSYLELQFT